MSCPCCGCTGTCVKNPECQNKGPNCYCYNSECETCIGECADDNDCDTPCRCYKNDCVGKCNGPCANGGECPPGCICVFGQCKRCDGCFEPTNCTLTVTVTFGSGIVQTYTYPDTGPLMNFGFGPCSVSAFRGDVCAEGGGTSYFKEVELVCDDCCDDGSGKNCRLGAVVTEEYYNDCPIEGSPPLYITNYQFALNCGPSNEPCNPLP